MMKDNRKETPRTIYKYNSTWNNIGIFGNCYVFSNKNSRMLINIYNKQIVFITNDTNVSNNK